MPVRNSVAAGDDWALLNLLNSTPVEAGEATDLLDDRTYARALARALGGLGTDPEVRELRELREHLRSSTLVGVARPELDQVLQGVVQRPLPLTPDGLRWELYGSVEGVVAARVVIAWARAMFHTPGRLRPCGNDECRLFLIDHSKGNTARWCSMAVCGNRMKARRHHARQRGASTEPTRDQL